MAFTMLTTAFLIFLLGSGTWAVEAHPPRLLKYYLQQQFGVNELVMVPAARAAVNGTAAGFGLEVVYEFLMTKKASPQSTVLGYVRGTAIVVNNTVGGNTFFVQNVIHYDSGSRRGTLSQQGEAIFENSPWEFAITGGTGIFRNAHGYNVGRFISATPTPNGTIITTYYEANLSYFQP
ncbi:hypothetical protein KP509_21G039400 [Ceratopteris richardii]|uniref:Dirigent protein n=1 Tax=Ceratopteris richardii TaxID=49495 RepID=A0A8T2SB20_CERRI|nr:hypothetical protein KP509_21G039400 [Ceratopteris richardii]